MHGFGDAVNLHSSKEGLEPVVSQQSKITKTRYCAWDGDQLSSAEVVLGVVAVVEVQLQCW